MAAILNRALLYSETVSAAKWHC